MTNQEDWRERFREYVNEVRHETHWGEEQDSPTHYFGCKTQRKDESGIELFTITDFGHVEDFIAKEISLAETKIANKYREHLRFIYRWVSRLNGDKTHDRPESNWKEYVQCIIHYPISPWNTGDWFEEPLESVGINNQS